MNAVYKSRIDAWVGFILGAVPLVSLYAAWQLVHAPVPGRWLVAVSILLLGACLPLSLLLSTSYRLGDGRLRIRSGFFTWDIPLQSISKVEATHDAVSSPALSLDRIRIVYGSGKSVLVSPLKKDDFLRELRNLRVPVA